MYKYGGGMVRADGQKRPATMPRECSVEAALAAGFTREVFATSEQYDHYLLIKPEADLDDAFVAYEPDQAEWIRINGSLYTFEDAPGACIGPFDGILRKEA